MTNLAGMEISLICQFFFSKTSFNLETKLLNLLKQTS